MTVGAVKAPYWI